MRLPCVLNAASTRRERSSRLDRCGFPHWSETELTIGAWRPLRKNDLAQVVEIAAATFPDHPEDAVCFEERIATSRWCLGLDDGEGGLDGYLVAYPWPLGDIPPLNTLLGPVRDAGGALFLHDLALRPVTAGRG